ncbi:NAD(P)/FAD-dependent oxidoreductase [Vibrio diazotrophicus]|uniref:NAD(P)/FAD-dependent oxidoreductase n=1 Tax=Vibrio diazotrophicus TaxID=685 RepID=UPI000C9E4260|nr:FAD-binding oxidoreductase [Vibrio diazotrophicus]PNH96066.1 D-amino-acid oxidase [Vibrio diazotrophicus]
MTKTLERIQTTDVIPESTSVVIIGGGIVGVSAALTLAERNIPVVLLEKGHIAGEQSSRNLGWIRKTNRHFDDVPLAQAADKLWAQMSQRVGRDVGYKQAGIMFLSDSEEQLVMHESWLESVKSLELDSRMLTPTDVDTMVQGGKGKWLGGIYTPSDGRAEPAIATSAMAQAAVNKGAILVQNCAVRGLSRSAGKVTGVVTEQGEIRCEQVLLAGGAWSRRFLDNEGISLPTLPLICSVMRTKPMEGPTEIAVGASNFSFRKHQDGGFIITQRGALDAPLCLDHLLIGHRYLSQLKSQRSYLRVSLGNYFLKDLAISRRWDSGSSSPFEKVRTIDPLHNSGLNQEALTNLRKAWPAFDSAQIEEAWAGQIDVTPDSNPVIDRIKDIPGLTIATGFSGHGFGTGPAAGQLAADLVSGMNPILDPSPYRFDRL